MHQVGHLLLLLLTEIVLVPSPFLLELRLEEVDAPAGLFLDLFKDGQDFSLFGEVSEAFGGYGEGADCYTCNAPDTSE